MQKYLPGSTFVVKNLPGAGHLVGTNTIYASKPDGMTIGTFNTGLIYNQLIGLDGVKFDLNKMSWIGKAALRSTRRYRASESADQDLQGDAGLQRPAELLHRRPRQCGYVETVMLTKTLKLPAKVMTGYNGSDDQLAMRRGEIQASIASRSSWEGFVKNGFGRFVVQIGGNQKDLPQLSAQTTDPERQSADRAGAEPGRHLAPDRRPAGHSGRPPCGATRCLQEIDGRQGAAGARRKTGTPGRSSLWRAGAQDGEGGTQPVPETIAILKEAMTAEVSISQK